jgi:nucleoside 2-deoxyribosyltransferase
MRPRRRRRRYANIGRAGGRHTMLGVMTAGKSAGTAILTALAGLIPICTAAVAQGTPALHRPALYLAGPLGFTEAGTRFKNDVLIPRLHARGFDVIDPWTLTPESRIRPAIAAPEGAPRREAWSRVDVEIARNNVAGIDRADGVLAVLDGSDVDSGTAAEIGYAFARGKPIAGYRGDFRLASDNEGSTVNLQVQYFITHDGGRVAGRLDALDGVLAALRSRICSRADAPRTLRCR